MSTRLTIPVLLVLLILAVSANRSKTKNEVTGWISAESVDLIDEDGGSWSFTLGRPTVLICARSEAQYLASLPHQELFNELKRDVTIDTRLVIADPPAVPSASVPKYLLAPEARRALYDRVELPCIAIIRANGMAADRRSASSNEVLNMLFE